MGTDDSDLLWRYVRNGSNEAFRELVQRHLGVVFHAALRQTAGDRSMAEDVVQEVFVLLARRAPSLVKHPVLIGWLFSATRRIALRAVRSARRRQRREHQAWQMEAGPEPVETVDRARLSEVLDAGMDGLGRVDRDLLLLRFFEARSYADVGNRLGLSEDAARMRVTRAVGRLRARLERHGMVSTSAALSLALGGFADAAAPGDLVAGVAETALHGASAAGGACATIAQVALMTKTQWTVVAGLAALVASGIGWQSLENESLARAIAVVRTQDSETEAATEPATDRVHSWNPDLAGAAPAAVADERKVDPKRDAFVRWARKSLDLSYAAFFRELRLPEQDLERLKDLLADREWQRQSAYEFASEKGLQDMRGREFREIKEAVDTAVGPQLRALLGEAAYARFEFHDRVSTLRNMLSPLAEETEMLGIPLSDDQMNGLLELAYPEMIGALDSWREGSGPVISDELVARAAAFLSPAQIAWLQDEQAFFNAGRRIGAMNREAALQGRLKLTEQSARYYPSASDGKE